MGQLGPSGLFRGKIYLFTKNFLEKLPTGKRLVQKLSSLKEVFEGNFKLFQANLSFCNGNFKSARALKSLKYI